MLSKEATQKCVSETVKSQDKNVSEGLLDYGLKQNVPLAVPGSKGQMLPEATFL